MAKENKNQTVVNQETPESKTQSDAVQESEKTEVIPSVDNDQPDETPVSVKVIVVNRFRDKNDHKTYYEVDQELEFDEERANDLVGRGLAKVKNDSNE